jgi:hypothetical protein
MLTGNDLLIAVQKYSSMTEKETKTYDDGVSDCWNYLYYELGMKDLADQMFDYVSNQQTPPVKK